MHNYNKVEQEAAHTRTESKSNWSKEKYGVMSVKKLELLE